MQEITAWYEVSTANLETKYAVKKLVYDQAAALNEIGLAKHQLNTAIEDYANDLKEKNDLILQYAKALEYQQYNTKELLIPRIVEARIMRSQNALDVAEHIRKGAHYAYLAAKAVEYAEVKPWPAMYDLYKVLHPKDLDKFITDLENHFKVTFCVYGGLTGEPMTFRLVRDVLKITDDVLIQKFGTSTDLATQKAKDDYKVAKVQEFIGQHLDSTGKILQYSFATSVYDAPPLNPLTNTFIPNVKIWSGVPAYCTISSQNASFIPRGLSIKVESKQTEPLEPRYLLMQKGHSTYLTQKTNQKVVEYTPVSRFFNIDYSVTETTGTDCQDLTDPKCDATRTEAAFSMQYKNNGVLQDYWTDKFTNRSIASSDWELSVYNNSVYFTNSKIDWSKVTDIVMYMDVISFY